MAKTQIAIRLDDELLELVDELAKAEDRTRTDVIEGVLERWIGEEQRFSDVSKIPGLPALMDVLVSSGLAGGFAKVLGRELDDRRVRMVKELRRKRRGRGADKLKGV
jgi:hypothetical protein